MRTLQSLWLRGAAIDDEALSAVGSLSRLTHLDLSATAIRGTKLSELQRLKSLKYLAMFDVPVGDEAARDIGAIPSIETLFLADTKIGDRGARELKGPYTYLNLSGTLVTDQSLLHFASIRTLGLLDLKGCNITHDAAAKFRTVRPDVTLIY